MTKSYRSNKIYTPHFLTFTIVKWVNIFTEPIYYEILWNSLQYCRENKYMKLYAYVFMTNHIHLIISATNKNYIISDIIRDFRKYTAQKIISEIIRRDNRKWILDILKYEGRKRTSNKVFKFWTDDDKAREIYSNKFFIQKFNYIHDNPVKAGIVCNSIEYQWSSARSIYEGNFQYIDQIDWHL